MVNSYWFKIIVLRLSGNPKSSCYTWETYCEDLRLHFQFDANFLLGFLIINHDMTS